MDSTSFEKRGYLLEEFRLFHLKDAYSNGVDSHYHDFHKLIIILSGEAGYVIEGRRYGLKTGDIVLVGRGRVHRPEAANGSPCDRLILYLDPGFLRENSDVDCDLESCFTDGSGLTNHVLRGRSAGIITMARELETAMKAKGFGQALLCRCLLLRLLIELERGIPKRELSYVQVDTPDKKTGDILRYINDNLTDELGIDGLAERFYVSKYHMMRSFKEDTGCSIHGYISDRRLMLARDLIAQGMTATEACYRSGFRSYSAFLRAYIKLFGSSPRQSQERTALPERQIFSE